MGMLPQKPQLCQEKTPGHWPQLCQQKTPGHWSMSSCVSNYLCEKAVQKPPGTPPKNHRL